MKALHRLLPAGWLLMLFSPGMSAQTITSFNPTVAPAGTTVVISGTGFSSTPANNKAWFGSIPAVVTAASGTSLSVTAPASAPFAPISVKVAGSGFAVSSHPFSLTVQAGELSTGVFTIDETIAVSSNEPALIDVNQDGKLDLLLPDPFLPGGGTENIGYYSNTSSPGDISFASRVDLPVGDWDVDRIATGDLDLDGKLDYVFVGDFIRIFRDVGTTSNPNLELWKEIFNPDMTGGYWRKEVSYSSNLLHMAMGLLDYDPFAVTDTYPSSSDVWVPSYITHMKSQDAVIRDFDGDGRLDIAVAYRGTYDHGVDGRVRIFLNKVIPIVNTIQFQLWVDLEIREPQNNRLDGYSLTAGDVNGDGRMDLAVAGHIYPYAAGMLSFIMNLPSGFVSSSWVLPARTERLVLADFDGDSKLDVAYQMFTGFQQHQSLMKIVVARNMSTTDSLVFQHQTEFPYLGRAGLQVSDFDGDGRPDLLWPCDGCSGLAAVRNTGSPGTIAFSSPIVFLNNLLSIDALAVGDLDGDGMPDIVAAESNVSVIRNMIPPYSLAQSLVAVDDPSITKNSSTTLSLQLKDALGNNVDGAGLSVVFSLTGGGTSAGTIGTVTYNGGGLYSAEFTGTDVGTARNVSASIEGSPVTSTLPTISVAGGSPVVAQSTVTISRPIVTSGAIARVVYQAKDANGDTLTTGGLSGVTFFLSGSGTSSGSFSSVVDSGNGKYYSTFTASTAGTAISIGARIGTDTVQSAFPIVTVTAGVFSTSTSVLSIASSSILKHDTTTATLQIKDGSGNNVTTGGLDVKITIFGSVNPVNDGKVYLTDVVDHQDGTYSVQIIGLATGLGSSAFIASIYNATPGIQTYQNVNSFPSPVTVEPRPASLAHSEISWGVEGDSTLALTGTTYFTLVARNDKGEPYTASNLSVNFTLASDGTATLIPLEAPHNDGGGLYRALYQGTGVGTGRTLSATIGGQAITTDPRRIGVVPNGPGLFYPGHFQTDVPLDTAFSWETVTGATSYRVVVVADSVGGQPIVDTSGVTGTSLQVSDLSHSRTYHWWVISYHQDLEGGGGSANNREFTTSQGPPEMVAPFDRETGVGLPPVLQWLPSPGATSYRLQIATDTSFVALVSDQNGLTDTSATVTGLATNSKYYWRVNAQNTASTSDYASFKSFTTSATSGPQTLYYVTTAGDDNANGTSWAEAFATVQKALTISSAGDEIWVAAGTYKPTATTDRTASFVLKNGVAVYGGFIGSESARTQRDWETNTTILSGDVDSDETIANNSYHVVLANTYATAILDGFTVTGGNAEGHHGGGIYSALGYARFSNLIISNNRANDLGGGVYNFKGSPSFFNVTFSGNQSDNRGGGMFNEEGHPTFTHCTFTGNSAFDGGGVSNGTPAFPAPTGNPVFTNVAFRNNTATHDGAGIHSWDGSLSLRNVLFHENTAGRGGGVWNFRGNISLTNVTFSNNVSYSGGLSEGGGMYTDFAFGIVVKNVLFWGNTSDQLYVYRGTVTIYNSLIQGGIEGPGVLSPFGDVIDSSGNIDGDPLFLDAGADDLRLGSGSPAIDAGMNEIVSTVSDLAGNPRIDGAAVDIGAYESQFAAASFAAAISRADSANTLGSTNIELSFSGIAPDRTVFVFSSHYQVAPDSVTFSGSAPAHFSPFRWVLTKVGDPFSSAELSIDNVSAYPGVVDPASLVIYRRSTIGDGDFGPLTTSYDAGADKLTATITSFSEFMIGSDNNPLPVQIASFTASANRMNAELKWRTESEVENYGFEVERREIVQILTDTRRYESENDGAISMQQRHPSPFTLHPSPWISIGFLQGAGTSSSPRDYSFVDKQVPPGRYAYRIKQIDQSGTITYTSSLEVLVGIAPLEFSLSQNYPNPFNPTTTIEFTLPEDGRVKLRIYNMIGEEIATLVDEDRKAGVYQQVVFDATRLATGVYVSRLEFKEKQLIKKMLLVK